jgi:hypothetical protein
MSDKGAVQRVHHFDHEGLTVAVVNPHQILQRCRAPRCRAVAAELGQALALIGHNDAVRRSARLGAARQSA